MPSKKGRRRLGQNATEDNREADHIFNDRRERYGFKGGRKDKWSNNRNVGRSNNRNYNGNNSRSQKGNRGQEQRPRGVGSDWGHQGGDHVYGFRKFREDYHLRDNKMGSTHRRFGSKDQFSNEQDNVSSPSCHGRGHEDHIVLNTTKQIRERRESESTSDSSSSAETEDSVVRDLKDTVNDTLLSEKAAASINSQKPPNACTTECNPTTTEQEKTEIKPVVRVKKEPTSKSDGSSSSSSSSSEESSSSSDEAEIKKAASVEDVICLGQLEKIENLVEDEVAENSSRCALCDETGHISFHCQMICKNCSGKHHGLKDCPKPANLSVVFSNFIQFCLKQSCKYNPSAEFVVDENMQLIPSAISALANGTDSFRSAGKRRKKKSHSRTPRSSVRKRHKTTSSTSDTSSTDTSSRKRKRRNPKSESHPTPPPIPFAVPYPTAFNPAFGFGSSGGVNPLLAFSQMMGFNPASMNFRGDSVAKEL